MNSLIVSGAIFVLVLCGIAAGSRLRRMLPDHHLSKETQDVVRLGAGLIATMAALVLGLLITAAKTSFDTQNSQIKQITADVILLDTLLAEYGAAGRPIREQIRAVIGPFAGRLWHENQSAKALPFQIDTASEKIYSEIQSMAPESDLQRSLQGRAAQVSTDLAQARLLLFTERGNSIPVSFIAILAFWLVIIFTSFSLFAEMNATVFGFLSVFALSASCAIFLILELSEPFVGLLRIPNEPLLNALSPIIQ